MNAYLLFSDALTVLLIIFNYAINGSTTILNQFKFWVSYLWLGLYHGNIRFYLIVHMHFVKHY